MRKKEVLEVEANQDRQANNGSKSIGRDAKGQGWPEKSKRDSSGTRRATTWCTSVGITRSPTAKATRHSINL